MGSFADRARKVAAEEPVVLGGVVSALVSVGAITTVQGTAWLQVGGAAATLLVNVAVVWQVRGRVRPKTTTGKPGGESIS